MKRHLRPTRRPLIAFGIALSPVFAVGAWAWIKNGFRSDDLPFVLVPLLIYACMAIAIAGSALEINDEEIVKRSMFLFRTAVRFSDIERSDVRVIAERDHPAWIGIYKVGEEKPALNTSLKLYSKDDVAWLCAHPGIKAKRYAGFTKR